MSPSIELTPEKKRIALMAGALVLIGFFVWLQMLVLPQTNMVARSGSELTALRGKVERMRRDLSHLPEMERKFAEMSAQYSSPADAAPPEEQLPNLLDKITQFARVARVRVVTLKPKEDLAKVQIGSSGYLEIPLELEATAGYHQVGRFLDQLEQSDSLVRLRELKIEPGADAAKQDVKMMLLAFLAPTPEAVAAADAAAAEAAKKPVTRRR